MTAPNATQRKACWDSKDELWKCLDTNGDQLSACEKYQREFEAKCPSQWVKYFTKRRDFLKYKERLEKGDYDQPQEETKT